MTRVVVQGIILFLLPFLGYGLFWLLMRRGQAFLASAPWFWLSVAGLSFACAGFVILVLTGGASPEGVYVPPHMDASGRIVPGHVEPLDAGS